MFIRNFINIYSSLRVKAANDIIKIIYRSMNIIILKDSKNFNNFIYIDNSIIAIYYSNDIKWKFNEVFDAADINYLN